MAADLGVIDEGLQSQMLDSIQASLNSAVFAEEAPLIGGQLAGREGLGQILNDLKSDLSAVQLESGATLVQAKQALESALEGKIAATGIAITESEDSSQVTFRIPVYLTKAALLDLDLGLGNNSTIDVLLQNEDAVSTNLIFELDLQFGVRELADGSSEFFFVTSGADEIIVHVDANLSKDFGAGEQGPAKGKMGVFTAEFQAADSESHFEGTYTIDLEDPNQDGFLVAGEFAGVAAAGLLNGQAKVVLDAEGSFLPMLGVNRESAFNLAVTNQLHIDYSFKNASTSHSNSDDQVSIDLDYQDTKLDLGTFYRDFVDPILSGIRDVIMPIKPMVDFLTDPIPGLAQFTTMSFLDVAKKAAEALPDSRGRDEALRKIDTAHKAMNLMNRILDYRTPGTGELDDATKNLGSVKAEFVREFGEKGNEDARPKMEQLKNISHEQKSSTKQKTQFEAQFEGDINMPILTSGKALEGLLSGDASTSLFGVDLNFDLNAIKYEYTAPIPALAYLANGEFKFELSAGLDLGFGFDAQGIADFSDSLDYSSMEAFEESKVQNAFLLDRSFYVDDNNVHQVADGTVSRIVSSKAELPEAYVSAKASVGGSLGPDWKVLTAKAGVLATLTANLNLDLNDLPDTLPHSEWVDSMTPTRPADPQEWTYDGHLRMDELQAILDYDPASIVNTSGELIVGADAFAKVSIVGLDLVDFQTTLVQVPIVDFNISKPNDLEVLENTKTDVTLGMVDQNGNLIVHAGNTASLRQGIDSTPSSAADENFRVRSLGEDESGHRVQVIYWFQEGTVRKSYSQTFTGVKKVKIDAGDGNDILMAEPGTLVPVHFVGGVGNDTLVGGRSEDRLEGSSGKDEIRGGAGNDFVDGGAGDDNIFGGTGNDTLHGGSGDDRILGEEGNDFLYGDAGADNLRGGLGDDELHGGDHDDALSGEEGSDTLHGDGGNDWLHGDSVDNFILQSPRAQGAGHDTIYGGVGEDQLMGGFGNDSLHGDSGNDVLWGEGGSDRLNGGAGNDSLNGDYSDIDNLFRSSHGNDTLIGGSGNDVLKGGYGNDQLYGSEGRDTLWGQGGNDYLDGGADNDVVYGDNFLDLPWDGGNDTLRGGSGDDELHGGYGNDKLYGDEGNDTIYGEAGDDMARGGSGNDLIYGDSVFDLFFGRDVLYGDDGNDSMHGGWGNDNLYGGNGNDSLHGNGGNDYVSGQSGHDKVYGGWGNDRLYGGSGNDRLEGDIGHDVIYGGAGNDYLEGFWGNDKLYGESGHDRIYGGIGNDYLYGGSGNDYMDGGLGGDRLYGQSGNDNLHGGRLPLLDQDLAWDYLDGGSGYDTINVSWYWFFGWHKEDKAVSGERII